MSRIRKIGWTLFGYLIEKPMVFFSISFYLAYFTLCLVKFGVLWVGLSLLFSLLVLGLVAGAGGRKRHSTIGGYYWTEPKTTTDFAILLFLLVFLTLTDLPLVGALTDLGFSETWIVVIFVFITGFASAMTLATQTKVGSTR